NHAILDMHKNILSSDHYGDVTENRTEKDKLKPYELKTKIQIHRQNGAYNKDETVIPLVQHPNKNEVSPVVRDISSEISKDKVEKNKNALEKNPKIKDDNYFDPSAIMLEEMAMLKDAKVIYFGLTGNEGKFPDSVTSLELNAILNDPELRKKTVFFK